MKNKLLVACVCAVALAVFMPVEILAVTTSDNQSHAGITGSLNEFSSHLHGIAFDYGAKIGATVGALVGIVQTFIYQDWLVLLRWLGSSVVIGFMPKIITGLFGSSMLLP